MLGKEARSSNRTSYGERNAGTLTLRSVGARDEIPPGRGGLSYKTRLLTSRRLEYSEMADNSTLLGVAVAPAC